MRTILILGCVAAMTAAGCMPEATVDGRSLTGLPVPPGKMAVLPVLLTEQVQDHTLAVAFVRELTEQLKDAGANLALDDLGGKVSVRMTGPKTAPPNARDPLWMSLPTSQRVELARGKGYATICQPVVVRYGRYPVYVPPQTYTQYYGALTDPPGPGPDALAMVELADRGGGHGGGGFRGGHMGRFSPWVWDDGDYYVTYIPGHYEPGAQITLALHLFDAATGQRIYYLIADCTHTTARAPDLENGFAKPLAKGLAQALAETKK